MLIIDGAHGEGGGQILRTSLALALVTGRAFRIERIRARRAKPGLLRQHLTAAAAAAEVGQAEISGAHLGSGELTFVPQSAGAAALAGGEYRFSIGTAGSTTLVFQTVLPALALAKNRSVVTLEGGTHNQQAPTFDFLERAYLPLVGRTGVRVRARLERPGFYPAGGGLASFEIEPTREFQPLELTDRGALVKQEGEAVVAKLPRSIAERELAVIKRTFDWPDESLRAVNLYDSLSPGNYVSIEIACEQVCELFTGVGARGVTAELVAAGAATEAAKYLVHGRAAVGEYLADQLLLPLVLARRGSFTTLAPLSSHTTTNIETIKRFLDVRINVRTFAEDVCCIEVGS